MNFIIKPVGGQYVNSKMVGDKEIIVNTSIENAKDVNRVGEIAELPIGYKGDAQVGDRVICQHNVFRTTLNDKGVPMESNHFIKDGLFSVHPDLVYLIIRDGEKIALDNYVFIKPIVEQQKWIGETLAEHRGIVKFPNRKLSENGVYAGDEIAFRFNCEYEFNIDGETLYMMNVNRVLAKLEMNH
jgi:hypothetical protein